MNRLCFIGIEIEYLRAETIEEGFMLYNENPDVDLIVVDACVPGHDPNTMEFVKAVRKTFSGPMIATSSDPNFRKLLLKAGCDVECEDKFIVPQKIKTILYALV